MLAFAPLHDAVAAAGTALSWLTDLLEPLAGGDGDRRRHRPVHRRRPAADLAADRRAGPRGAAPRGARPQVRDLQRRYADDPATLQSEVFALYRTAGANPIAGCLPLLLQAPFLLVLYRLFTTSEGGTGLLDERLAGVPLGHISATGWRVRPGRCFGVLLAVLLALAWWSSRRARRASAAVGTVAGTPTEGPGAAMLGRLLPAAAVHDGAGGAGAAAGRGDLPGDHDRVVGAGAGGAPPSAGGRAERRSRSTLTTAVAGRTTLRERSLDRPRREARPWHLLRRPPPPHPSDAAWLASVLLVATTTALAGVTMTAQAAVPPPPTGWSTVWSDDFTGAAGTLPSAANWIIDTGHSYPGGPANWGTGEIQTLHRQHRQPQPRRQRQPADHPAARRCRRLDLRPDRDRAQRLQGPAGGVLAIEGRIQMPNVTGAAAPGYWPAFWALGAPVPGQLPELAGHRRVRHDGERQRAQLGLGRAALRRRTRAGRATRPTASAPSRACPGSQLPVGVPHLPVRVGHLDQPRSNCAGTSTASFTTPSPRARSAADTGRR